MFQLASSSDEDDQEEDAEHGDEAGKVDTSHSRDEAASSSAAIQHAVEAAMMDDNDDDSDDSSGSEGFLTGLTRKMTKLESPSPVENGPQQRHTDESGTVEARSDDPPVADEAKTKQRETTKKQDTARLTCPDCNRVFATASGLKYHKEQKGCIDKNVHHIGRKARQTLQNIKSQRAVIRRVDPALLPTTEQRTSVSIPSPTIKKRKRAVRLPKQQRAPVEMSTSLSQNVDRWMPDISSLAICSRETRSAIVQLHGIPVSSTPEHVAGFFSGLSVRKIWILPPFPHRVAAWDANHSAQQKKGLHVQRCPPTLRVLVKFQDAPTAEVAARRSGELLHMHRPSTNDDESKMDMDQSNECEVALAVTQWTKEHATYFIRNQLAIDAKSKIPLTKILDDAIAALKPAVARVIWTRIVRDLNLSIDSDGDEDVETMCHSKPNFLMLQGSAYVETVRRHNQRLQDYNRLQLVQQCVCDPTLLEIDSMHRLTTKAVEFLKQELDELDQSLVRARRWKLLQLPLAAKAYGETMRE